MLQLPDTATEQGQRLASVMLGRLMGELSECTCGTPGCTVGMRIDNGNDWFVPKVKNLYAPANMALAWRVLNWSLGKNSDIKEDVMMAVFDVDGWRCAIHDLLRVTPEKAQRAGLDKILSLAIEAGMVDAAAKE